MNYREFQKLISTTYFCIQMRKYLIKNTFSSKSANDLKRIFFDLQFHNNS